MTDKRPQTIQFFLPQGEPRGIRIADITTRIVQAVLVPRRKVAEVSTIAPEVWERDDNTLLLTVYERCPAYAKKSMGAPPLSEAEGWGTES